MCLLTRSNTYTNHTWAELSGHPVKVINVGRPLIDVHSY